LLPDAFSGLVLPRIYGGCSFAVDPIYGAVHGPDTLTRFRGKVSEKVTGEGDK